MVVSSGVLQPPFIPAQAGIQEKYTGLPVALGPRLRGDERGNV
jgi:hypothetical protein